MTTGMRLVAATSACVIVLAFTEPAIGGDSRGSALPRSGGYVENWYFGVPESFGAEEDRSGESERRQSWAASGLPRSGGPIEDWYFGMSLERSDFASFETESIPPHLPRSGGHVEDRYFPAADTSR
jgi:hypothetical protein